MEEFLGLIMGTGMFIAMCYILYQHFTTPFKNLSKANKIKKLTPVIKEILNDEAVNEKITIITKELENKNINNNQYKELLKEILFDKYKELYKDNQEEAEEIIIAIVKNIQI